MIKDQYAFNPMLLGPELSLSSKQNIVESVPVSQYGSYLEALYGPDVPHNKADRYAADTFFDAATAYSTDTSMYDILTDKQSDAVQKVKRFIPRWLQLTEPVVDSARLLDKVVDRHLDAYDDGELPNRYDNLMHFMVGIFYSSTQLASLAVDIPHPSQLHPDLVRPALNSGRKLIGGRSDEKLPQTMLLIPGIARAEDIRKANKLKIRTATLNVRAQKAAERMIAVTSAIQGKKELEQLLGN